MRRPPGERAPAAAAAAAAATAAAAACARSPLTTSFCNDYEGVHACASTRGAYEDPDPDHSVSGTAQQLYGTPEPPAEHDPASVTLSGFVASYAGAQGGNASRGAAIMDMMAPAAVPVISALARAFTVVDRYHASVPGPTFPNRLFAMSGTSHGYGDNDVVMTARGWPQTSVFGRLDAIGAASRVYFSDVPSALLLADARNLSSGATAYKSFEADFAKDVAAGDLPPFTWVEPSYLDIPGIAATDEHPAHDGARRSHCCQPPPPPPPAAAAPAVASSLHSAARRAAPATPTPQSPLASASSSPSTRRCARGRCGIRRCCF